MRAIVLRFDAPMLAFGGVAVDQHGVIDRFPGASMLTGLLGNALGWSHGDAGRLGQLQDLLTYAARWDVPPIELVDYHTVDLGQPKMASPGWTTRGEPEHRQGGSAAKFGTHQRYRHYWTDGLATVLVSVSANPELSLEALVDALRFPARPLFLGRKTCLPSRPLLDRDAPVVEGDSLYHLLAQVPVLRRDSRRRENAEPLMACWPASPRQGRGELRRVYDRRDWARQLPAGTTLRMEGMLGGEEG